MTFNDSKILPQAIRSLLNSRTPKAIEDDNYSHAGVLIPLFRENGQYKVLFTKRTDTVEHHKGQISFPGGGAEKEDKSFEETALREAWEEIGLAEEDVEILGKTDDMITVVSNFVIHPFVGLIPFPYNFTENGLEVERIITAPLEVFRPGNTETRRWSAEYQGVVYNTPAYQYGDDLIWGATARVMENFMEVIGHKLPLPDVNK
ncbi:NUDIX hydrolase [Thermodesulfobacteriota bacterium]